jgi:hypothetical protein
LIEKKLEESGEKARLEEYLRQKLIECGWKDELKKYCLGKFPNDLPISNFPTHSNLLPILTPIFRPDQEQGTREDQLGRLGGRTPPQGQSSGSHESEGGPVGQNQELSRE